jgi:S1-C subfamily serine protease
MGPPDEDELVSLSEHPGLQRRKKLWRLLGVVGICALLLLIALDTFRANQPRLSGTDVSTAVARALASATPPPSFASLVYQQVQPSVVLIQRFAGSKQGEPDSEGTGVVVDQSGLILTALHVVQNAGRIVVTFADGSTSDATIFSQQPENDIAVIRVAQMSPTIPPAIMGDPGSLHVGDEAIVIGNPFGLVDSLSVGAISGIDRTFVATDTRHTYNNLIQFDASVNPGNSGGPLLDRNGEVVGIVTGLANPTKDNVFIGIGFAVPISSAGRALGEPPY